MATTKIKVESIEPTGIVIDDREIYLSHPKEYFRLVLQIGDHYYMVTEDGACVRKMGK